MLKAVPMRASERAARMARKASPWARFTVWVARRKASRSRRPGAWMPDQVAHHREDGRLVEDQPAIARGRRGRARRLRRSRRSAPRCRASASRRVLERLRAGPSGRASGTGGCPRRAARRSGGRSSRRPSALTAPAALGLDARPGDREAVAAEVHLAHQRDVLARSGGRSRRRRRRCLPSLILPGVWVKRSQIDSPLPSSLPGALDLVGGRGRPPVEALRKAHATHVESSRARCSKRAERGAASPWIILTAPSWNPQLALEPDAGVRSGLRGRGAVGCSGRSPTCLRRPRP